MVLLNSEEGCHEVPFYAHTPNQKDEWHDLKKHLETVAQTAQAFAEPFGAGMVGYWAGKCHDLGKYTSAFQEYLRAQWLGKTARKVPHAKYGALWAYANPAKSEDISLCVAGHHAGLPNQAELRQRMAEVMEDPRLNDTFNNAQNEGMAVHPSEQFPLMQDYLKRELFVRMAFSALVDADYLDTEEHFDEARASQRGSDLDMSTLWERFRCNQERLLQRSSDTLVNRVRREVYEACIEAAKGPRGVYRLTVPTGGGKTRSSLGFALAHALNYRLRRIVVAIPYTSIIDQTAKEYRDVLGDEAVLEHHSAVAWRDDETDLHNRLRLASENWDAPLIVTTTVQLFESLFANRPGPCRKLHRLAHSIIVLDEVQTLPVELLTPTIDVLKALVEDYGVTLVLSTATQPALEGESPYLKAFPAEGIKEMVPNPEVYFQILKRVEYDVRLDPVSWEEVARWVSEKPQVLVVLNTRREALELLDLIGEEDVFHLSTLLCSAHRKEVLDEVRRRLRDGSSIRLISTQVVEAGVDLDFPIVYRAVGPLDRIVQAAGRCNREGKLEKGRVVVFSPAGGRSPKGPYLTAMNEADILLREGVNLHDPAVYQRYFRRLYQSVDTDANGILALRRDMNFPEVADRYRLIRDDTEPIVVRYRPEVDALLDKARAGLSRELFRDLQPYIVNLAWYQVDDARRNGLMDEVAPGVVVWRGIYHRVKGLVASQVVHDPADLILTD